MKTVPLAILFAAFAWADSVRIIVTADDGKIVKSDVTLVVPLEVITALNQWRLADQNRVQTGTDPQGNPTWRNMTVAEMWRTVVKGFIVDHIPGFHAQIQTLEAEIAVRRAQIAALKDAAATVK